MLSDYDAFVARKRRAEVATGHKPGNSEIDVPINYADYYFLEALLRFKAGLARP